MPLNVSDGGAFVAGLISFVSPCVLPLVPPYLCFLAGVSFDEMSSADDMAAGLCQQVDTRFCGTAQ